ncbi:hypothetical protein [Streptomyces griseosporeus]|uniref:hypothetical protein n=1 Tax=Streptomyces griseosporeus TaxID=1910 RepID=UPI0036FBA7AA
MSGLARMAAIGASAAAMLFASAHPSIALESGEIGTLSNKTISVNGGTLRFIDDGDVFEICDTQADGYGVYGALYYNSYVTPDGWQRVMSLDDGGDAGCDKKGYNIGNGGSYVMTLCWTRPPRSPFEVPTTSGGLCTNSGEFNE